MALRLGTQLAEDMADSISTSLGGGYIKLYGSPRPASADDAETGTLLVTITLNSGAHDNTGTNGLTFDASVAGVLSKAAAETWSGVAVADGTAVWGRFYPQDETEGASTISPRLDFSVGTSGADLNMSSVSITNGASQTVDSFDITMPNGE